MEIAGTLDGPFLGLVAGPTSGQTESRTPVLLDCVRESGTDPRTAAPHVGGQGGEPEVSSSYGMKRLI